MKTKKVLSLLLAFGFCAAAFSACRKNTGDINTPVTSTTFPQETLPLQTDPSESSASEPSSAQEETTRDNFRFKSAEALKLGEMESEIYGKLTVYYQDSHIAILDAYDSLLFSFDAQNYAPSSDAKHKTVEYDDMNFDGYADLRLLYRSTALNTYYLCWMWDMPTKSFVFYEPLSDIPTPTFEPHAHTVVSLNKSSPTSATLTTYSWQDGELYPVDHKVVSTEEETVTGADDVDSSIAITDGFQSSVVVLTGNKFSGSRWICKIEDESLVKLQSSSYNENDLSYKFIFKGIAEGTTTVVFRFATSWDADHIAEKVVNITVHKDKTLSIVEIR